MKADGVYICVCVCLLLVLYCQLTFRTILDNMQFSNRVKKVSWPCLVCGVECRSVCTKRKNIRCIECSVCSGWTHEKCASLTLTTFDYFAQDSSIYLCERCVSDSDRNTYSYTKALLRFVLSNSVYCWLNVELCYLHTIA
jgi:hypothetical protein